MCFFFTNGQMCVFTTFVPAVRSGWESLDCSLLPWYEPGVPVRFLGGIVLKIERYIDRPTSRYVISRKSGCRFSASYYRDLMMCNSLHIMDHRSPPWCSSSDVKRLSLNYIIYRQRIFSPILICTPRCIYTRWSQPVTIKYYRCVCACVCVCECVYRGVVRYATNTNRVWTRTVKTFIPLARSLAVIDGFISQVFSRPPPVVKYSLSTARLVRTIWMGVWKRKRTNNPSRILDIGKKSNIRQRFVRVVRFFVGTDDVKASHKSILI